MCTILALWHPDLPRAPLHTPGSQSKNLTIWEFDLSRLLRFSGGIPQYKEVLEFLDPGHFIT